MKSNKIIRKFPLSLCTNSCELNCRKKFNSEEILEINKQFWEMTKHEQKNFILNNTIRFIDESINSNELWNKKYVFQYYIKFRKVCNKFFLGILGYSNNNIIYNLSQAIDKSKIDWNKTINVPYGSLSTIKNEKRNKRPDTIFQSISKFINDFDPQYSHYNREKCPNKRYIENTNCIELYKEFAKLNNFTPIYDYKDISNSNKNLLENILNQNNARKCKYSYFYQILKYKLNISFINQCYFECKICKKHKIHHNFRNNLFNNNCNCTCNICQSFIIHIEEVKHVRDKYRSDANNVSNLENSIKEFLYVSIDTQKVLHIPKLQIKEEYFSEKIGITNFTISELGKNGQSICFVTHEAEVDKKASDFCNYYYQFIKSEICQNVKNIIIKTDNCSKENKNYTLISNLLIIINDPIFKCETLTIEYLTSGHTFMSADRVHGNIEKKLNSTPEIYDFKHIIEIMQSSRENLSVIPLKYSDFYEFIDNCKPKRPLSLRKVKSIQFRKGFTNVFVKFAYNSTQYIGFDILKSDVKLELGTQINKNNSGQRISMLRKFSRQSQPKGISSIKYNSLVKNLESFPEDNYKDFFINLTKCDKRTKKSEKIVKKLKYK
jgi:hypothetical protein